MKFTIPGIPKPKVRPRFRRYGKGVITYDPQADEKKEVKYVLSDAIKAALASENKQIQIDVSNLTNSEYFDVSLSFYLPINENDKNVAKNAKLWGFIKPNKKPDLDNLEKFILDCANGIFYKDDKSIVNLQSKKLYSNNPRTEIEITGYKLNINPKVQKVFTMFTPDELQELVDDASFLSQAYDYTPISINTPVPYEDTTDAIIYFAIKHADKLIKIKKKAS